MIQQKQRKWDKKNYKKKTLLSDRNRSRLEKRDKYNKYNTWSDKNNSRSNEYNTWSDKNTYNQYNNIWTDQTNKSVTWSDLYNSRSEIKIRLTRQIQDLMRKFTNKGF